MKNLLLCLSLFVAVHSYAREEYAQVTIDWNARHLDETVVLMCDDTYYAGTEVTIPGEYQGNIESYIRYTDCDASVKITKKVKFIQNGLPMVKIRIKNDTSCTMEIFSDKESGKKFELYIADAC